MALVPTESPNRTNRAEEQITDYVAQPKFDTSVTALLRARNDTFVNFPNLSDPDITVETPHEIGVFEPFMYTSENTEIVNSAFSNYNNALQGYKAQGQGWTLDNRNTARLIRSYKNKTRIADKLDKLLSTKERDPTNRVGREPLAQAAGGGGN